MKNKSDVYEEDVEVMMSVNDENLWYDRYLILKCDIKENR